VRFAGRRVDGWLISREERSGHAGALTPLAAVVSSEPVLTPEVLTLARSVAEHWAGTLADVLRLAVPPRHARVEKQVVSAVPAAAPPSVDTVGGTWSQLDGGAAYLDRLRDGGHPRAVWSAMPGPSWPVDIALAAAATRASGRGCLIVVPDQRDLDRVDAALGAVLGPGSHISLAAGLGPPERYRRWLRALRGGVDVVVGTRAAAFAPVRDLGLIVCWDDGDDLLAEPRAPYPHARDVLVLRAHQAGAGALLGGHAVSVEAAGLVRRGWAQRLSAPREVLRQVVPAVRVVDPREQPSAARLPHAVFEVVRAALAEGPVLVQVPRRGYRMALRCTGCRAQALCPHCHGVLHERRDHALECAACGRPAAGWCCPHCRGTAVRAGSIGQARTAEELGRAFPGFIVHTSAGDAVMSDVADRPALVVATPGAEPVCAGDGYRAALLLDADALLGRASMRAAEEAARRWFAAAALVRPRGEVVLVGPPEVPAAQALVRWDPFGLAEREAEQRAALALPPATRVAVVDCSPGEELALPGGQGEPGMDVLGPVPRLLRDGEPGDRYVLRVPRERGRELAALLSDWQRDRSAHRASPARVQLDPLDPLDGS
jgi:primosomal protein N' (replication factor Y)